MRLSSIVLILLTGWLVSCSKDISNPTKENHVEVSDSVEHTFQNRTQLSENTIKKDSILFLFFETTLDSAENTQHIQLKEIKKVAGRVKIEFDSYSSGAESIVNVAFLNKSKNVVKKGTIESPFKKSIEYLDENGKYNKATVVEPEFVIKTNHNKEYKFIRFYNNEISIEIALY